MDMLIDNTAGYQMFSFMDGYSDYNHIFMAPADVPKTAFYTQSGTYLCYNVMPFGLKNAGATYQRAMKTIFHDMFHELIEDYVDDIVVKSKTRIDHVEVLRKVLERCRKFSLRMNPLKCAAYEKVSAGKSLGFVVHHRGISIDQTKIKAILEMPCPSTVRQLKSYLGRLSYII